MEPEQDTSVLTIFNKNYDDAKRQLNEVVKKLDVRTLTILYTTIGVMKKCLLSNYKYLINVALSNCNICILEQSIFDNLIHLKTINLSNNLISYVSVNLFQANTQLECIFLRNNLLKVINKMSFSMLQKLDVLDLSYNYITLLDQNFIYCLNLKRLHLNYNQISKMLATAFNHLPNLTHLALNNNKITRLEDTIFRQTVNLRHLNLNNNVIGSIRLNFLTGLTQLTHFTVSNNLFSQSIDRYTFIQNQNLLEIDLSENEILMIEREAFTNCNHLKWLKLKVVGEFNSRSITHLESLTKFELVYETGTNFYLGPEFFRFLINKHQLVELKLIFDNLCIIRLCSFSVLINLEYLHIECKNPNNFKCCINFVSYFQKMAKLKKLALIRLNYCQITRFTFDNSHEITHLDLTAIQNRDYILYKFRNLKHLNLSFSKIENIGTNVLKNLTELESLNLSHSKLKVIKSTDFEHNVQLRYLDCSNCRIKTIEDFSFRNSVNLLLIDFSNNSIRLRITRKTVHGLKKEAKILI